MRGGITGEPGIRFGRVTVGTAPSIAASAGHLSGQSSGFTARWNKLVFRQGSSCVSGTYNATTHAYVLTWSSEISGGPFNGFTGVWRLQGTDVAPSPLREDPSELETEVHYLLS